MQRIVSTLRNWDGRIVIDVAHRRTIQLNVFMTAISRAGDGWAWLILSLSAVLFDPSDAMKLLVPLAVSFAIEIPIYKILKQTFSRPRPFQICNDVSCVLAPSDRFSFPSGHTSAAFVALTVAAAVYGWLFLPLMLIAVLIGISRVYLGVHYPSDVFAGALLGTACGIIGLWIG